MICTAQQLFCLFPYQNPGWGNTCNKIILILKGSNHFLPLDKYKVSRAVKKFFSSRLIMNSRQLWNLHQRHKFLRAEASRDILTLRVSEMEFPGGFKRYFPQQKPCCFVRIHKRLETTPPKCLRCSTTSHSLNISQILTCLNMHSESFKTEKQMLDNFTQWCLFSVSSYGRRRRK